MLNKISAGSDHESAQGKTNRKMLSEEFMLADFLNTNSFKSVFIQESLEQILQIFADLKILFKFKRIIFDRVISFSYIILFKGRLS